MSTNSNKFKQLELFLSETNSAINGSLEKTSTSQSEVDEPSYITPNVELKLSKEKRQICRDILLEIKNFGVSQRQILYLIYLLALELEDNNAMRSITAACGEHRENIPLTAWDLASQVAKAPKKKIIV